MARLDNSEIAKYTFFKKKHNQAIICSIPRKNLLMLDDNSSPQHINESLTMLTTYAIFSNFYKIVFTTTKITHKVLLALSTLKLWPTLVGYSAPKIILIGYLIMFTGK